MHTVILLSDVVKVGGVLVDRVVSEDSLKQHEGKEVLVLPAGGVIEHPNTRIDLFVVADHQQPRIVDGFL